ncbi:hypothetical protein TCAL_05107 [Tigriopus californicus]|uniref:Tubulin-tyrosine ligase n=1 Tax=Tigriopus californicus TaxID=6832 RepID=A0A553NUL7_TIGCA|nr:probable tubulin polyglutamylase ttll-15 [Tigriopus californicus]TRY69125.1 hypothetical protein TCAL_05107 [Tigriopus californicus]|eukprot:TCALIF_05107-PA protein Name:"Similar to ttll6 Tubulin polyglutamylase ttll6 (Danio rerio)" AED:0.28 eAED:0.28 QI:0/-1/0/1/-1/1/1/0/503
MVLFGSEIKNLEGKTTIPWKKDDPIVPALEKQQLEGHGDDISPLVQVNEKSISPCSKSKQPELFVIKTPLASKSQTQTLRRILSDADFEETHNMTDNWKLMWLHLSPRGHHELFDQLKPNQVLNRIPGFPHKILPILSKMPNVPNVPSTFVLPKETDRLEAFIKKNEKLFYIKRESSRKSFEIVQRLDLEAFTEEFLVQAYIDDSFLIDGHRFDIGVYVLITSIKPFRAYMYDKDINLRFCPKKYQNGFPSDPQTYVVESPRQTWLRKLSLPTIDKLRNHLGANSLRALRYILNSANIKDYDLWNNINQTVYEVLTNIQQSLLQTLRPAETRGRAFELVRFDFLIRKNGDIALMEMNRSPFLGEQHNPVTKLLHKQILISTLNIMGVLSKTYEQQFSHTDRSVFLPHCMSPVCSRGAISLKEPFCSFCEFSLTPDVSKMTSEAFLENQNKLGFRRLIPSPPGSIDEAGQILRSLKLDRKESMADHKMAIWYLGKCFQDDEWCY